MISGGWRRAALLTGVFVVGLGATGTAALALASGQQRHREQLLVQRAQIVQNAVAAEINRYVETLADLAVAAAQSDLTVAHLATVTDPVTRQRLPGATGVSFVAAAGDAQISALQAYWRLHGASGLTLASAGPALPHRFVVFNRRLDGTTGSVGDDLGGIAQPVEVMDTARATGTVTASGTYVLPRDRTLPVSQQQLSFVIVAPVRGTGSVVDGLRGWLTLGMRGGDSMTEALRRSSQNTVNVDLRDTSGPDPERTVASWHGGRLDSGAKHQDVTVTAAGRHWQLTIRPTTTLYAGADSPLGLLVWSGGAVATLLLVALVHSLSVARERALAAVADATTALRADIGRREQVETQLRTREAELAGFAAVAAHDLRAPLASMAGHADLLAEELPPGLPSEATGSLTAIRSGARRMALLIDDLLAYASAERGQLRLAPVDLGALTTEVLAECVPTVRPAPRVQVGRLPTVTADATLIRQLLDNLIGNALKYAPPGQAAQVEISAEPVPGSGWRIEVADRGIGVPSEQYTTVFNAFRRGRGSEAYPGTGLGLAICQHIVDQHGGRIGVEPNPGGGTRFWFTAP